MGHLWLIGMMGSGKSEVAERVAALSGALLIDLDQQVSDRAGRSIRAIFAESGEAAFRRREEAALLAASGGPRAVIATGGGVVLSDDNVRIMRETGTVVHLAAEPAELARRTGGDSARPLLSGGDPAEVIAGIHSDRAALYARARHHVIDTDRLTVADVAERANELWNEF